MVSENFKNKIQRLELENFTCFSKATFDFSSGINVFIGENGTGKTHILKAIYGTSHPVSDMEVKPHPSESDTNNVSFNPYFFIEGLGLTFGANVLWLDLVRDKKKKTSFTLTFDEKLEFGLSFSNAGLSDLKLTISEMDISTPLYLPPYEILSSNKTMSSDKISFDLSIALNKETAGKSSDLVHIFKKIVDVEVSKEEGVFYVEDKDGKKVKAAMNATGINKLAELMRCLQNGSLTKNTILCWDEPEVSLNPRYIKIVAKFLQTLAKNGVQIFVATHDYLLVHLLSLDAEYQQVTDAPPMKFFALTKGENGTEVESADTIAGITNNALLDEYSAYSELEHQLFKQSMQMV